MNKLSQSKPRSSRWWVRVLSALGLTMLGVVLLVLAVLMVVVSYLTPERLTPLVEKVATAQLQNARVEVDTVRLSLRSTMPFMGLDIDRLRIISTVFDSLPAQRRRNVPAWADTLLEVKHFQGGVNLAKLALNKLELSDVVITSPMANLVVLNDSVANFNIIPPSDEPPSDEPFDWNNLPEINIKRFAVIDPRPIRYYDVATGTDITTRLEQASISGAKRPLYRLRIGGGVEAPTFLKYFTINSISFGLDGNLHWDQSTPQQLEVSDMRFNLALINGTLNTRVDATNGLTLNTLSMKFEPISITKVLDLLPDTLRTQYGIPLNMSTNATVSIDGHLTRPFRVASEGMPHARVHVQLPDSRFQWEQVRFENVAADLAVQFEGDDFNATVVDINRLNVRGRAIDLSLSGRVSSLARDPLFDGKVQGRCDINHLPPVILNRIPGTVRGMITANAHFRGRPSMLDIKNYHRLHVLGDVSVDRFYWLDSDTINMVYAHHAAFDFGSNKKFRTATGQLADSLLTATLTIDSASVLHSDISMKMRHFSMGLGAQNKNRSLGHRSHGIVPLGGGLKIGAFDLTVLTDTAVVRFRDVGGRASVAPYNGDVHKPILNFDLSIGRFSTGDKSTRLMIMDCETKFSAILEPQTRTARHIHHLMDSVGHVHPDIPRDSVYAIALAIHNSRPKGRFPRVHPEILQDSTEVVAWNTSTGFQRLLTEWKLDGRLTAKRAGLFTRYFPLRNRIEHLDITFNNDSMLISDLRYKVGHSDFTLGGRVTNMRRAFTSPQGRQSLKLNLVLESDTIDVNQLMGAAYSGASYQVHKDNPGVNLSRLSPDEELEMAVEEHVQNVPDSMEPILIPKNIEATLDVRARNVIYSDLLLHNLDGRLLTYQGALSLHDLHASSDVGNVGLSALYLGRDPEQIKFGFSLNVDKFNIHRFLDLVPPVDSLMPLLRDFSGIITAEVAATSDISPNMDLKIPTLQAVVEMEGDSLVLIDPDTFKSLSKWLLFKKKQNIINHMSVAVTVRDNVMRMYPFMFDIDRYRLGVQGTNDFDMNFDYHISVLKSPIPFKFGINVKGNPDHFKIRLGGAKVNENTPRMVGLVDTTRVNLLDNLQDVFRRGMRAARFKDIRISNPNAAAAIDLSTDSLTHADSLRFIREGLIPAPDTVPPTPAKKRPFWKRKPMLTSQYLFPDEGPGGHAMPMLAVLGREPRLRKYAI